jgi:hypothetical protein
MSEKSQKLFLLEDNVEPKAIATKDKNNVFMR